MMSLYLLYLSALNLASPRAADSRTSGQGIKLCSAAVFSVQCSTAV